MFESQSIHIIKYYCYFSKFWDILKFFVITLKFDHKVILSANADGNENSFKPDQMLLFEQSDLGQHCLHRKMLGSSCLLINLIKKTLIKKPA